MAHVRTQLRSAVVGAVNGVTALKGRVTAARPYARNLDVVPAAEVLLSQEDAERLDGDSIQRAMDVTVHIAAASGSPEDDLDKIAVEVEKAVVTSADVQNIASDIYPSTTDIELGDTSERRPALMTITFAAIVLTMDNDPETHIGG